MKLKSLIQLACIFLLPVVNLAIDNDNSKTEHEFARASPTNISMETVSMDKAEYLI